MRNATRAIARVSLVCPVDQHSTESIDPLSSRFADLYQAFEHEGLKVDLVGYHDAHCERVFAQLQQSVGFGHQAINALHPAPDGAPPSDAPKPGPRLYHPPNLPAYQHLKNNLEA